MSRLAAHLGLPHGDCFKQCLRVHTCAERDTGVRDAAFGADFVVILAADGTVSSTAASNAASDSHAGVSTAMDIPEPVVSIAAGEQHR